MFMPVLQQAAARTVTSGMGSSVSTTVVARPASPVTFGMGVCVYTTVLPPMLQTALLLTSGTVNNVSTVVNSTSLPAALTDGNGTASPVPILTQFRPALKVTSGTD